jgi:hypothetical protein
MTLVIAGCHDIGYASVMTPTMRLIAVEVSAELWTAAITKSESNSDDLSEVVALGLERYIQGES